MANRRNKKKARQEDPDSSSDEEDERIVFFIPATGIDIEVLVFYLREYLGEDSAAEPGQHPQDTRKVGFIIRSRFGLTAAMVTDLKKDSIAWSDERKRSRVRDYSNSETAQRRRVVGASGNPTVPPKTAEKLRRAGSKPPATANPVQSWVSQQAGERQQNPTSFTSPASVVSSASWQTQQPGDRHQSQQPYATPSSAYPTPSPSMNSPNWATQYSGDPSTQRQQGPYSQNTTYPSMNYSQTGRIPSNYGGNNSTGGMSYTQNPSQRHQDTQPQSENVMPSIERRFKDQRTTTEDEDEEIDDPQPSTTGTHGFSSYSTAGSRHDRK